jgi:hypothetical protein
MAKDKRYITVKILMEAGHVTDFAQIFDHIPLSVVANDIGSNYVRFKRLVANPSRMKLIDVFILARLFEMPEMTMISLIIAQLSKEKSKNKFPFSIT